MASTKVAVRSAMRAANPGSRGSVRQSAATTGDVGGAAREPKRQKTSSTGGISDSRRRQSLPAEPVLSPS